MEKKNKIKNETELLAMFCDPDELQVQLRAPFFNTRYNEVWSSNGHILIRIKPERLTGEYQENELKMPERIGDCKKQITLNAINEALKKCPQVEDEVVGVYMTVDEKAIIKIGKADFRVKEINILIAAMKHLGVPRVELLLNPSWNMNEVAIGDIRIGIAPIILDNCECSAEVVLSE